ncbi:hypothetical protein ACFQGE_08965 [Halomicroarcula sp. GCM10025817]|uniref:hypothetical protein n=1 Tax=Haloarcula TaxID=2237 RepID=UPI0023E79117|nr:hypothetical protein [Halomicroarcula sp. SYNS111]
MSAPKSRSAAVLDRETIRVRARAGGRWLFGDRYGLVLWLALLFTLGATWRIGVFITDTYATANTLVALSQGSLAVTEIRYSLTLGSQPGLHRVDGLLYGRNYGQLAVAVPFVWLLEGGSVVVDARLLLAGLWSGLGLLLVDQTSRLPAFDRDRTLTVGSLAVAVLFVGTLLTATDLPRDQLVLAAYQLSTLVAAATAGLVCYRLFTLLHGRRVGLAGGVALGLATPVGFWATLPKRHTFVAMLALATVYAFSVSRHRADGRAALRARAGAYALAGFVTWTHAFEAFFLVATLGVVDVLTARSNSPRQLLVVGLALLAASTPMLATNYAISGNPAEPPRLLPNVGGGEVEFVPDNSSGADGGSDAAGEDSGGPANDGETEGGPPLLAPVLGATAAALSKFDTISRFTVGAVVEGTRVLDDPDRLTAIFVRSGNIQSLNYRVNDFETIELALLEAMPLLGALVAFPVLLLGRARRLVADARAATGVHPGSVSHRRLSPARQTDLLVGALAVVMTVIYLSRLPLHSMLTVRYLHPVVPLAVYGVVRLPAVRDAATRTPRWLAGSYLCSVALGLLVVLGGILTLDLAVGEAVQYHALANLVTATLAGSAVVGRTVVPDRVSARVTAVGLGLPAGFTTAYVLLAALVYFRYGTYAFDLVRVLAGSLPSL